VKVGYHELRRRQAWPLEQKIAWALNRIRIWYAYWGGKVYVSFSGGKDSTVLLHLVRSIYPDVVAVFCNTGLEFPEIITFVRETDNVTWLRPAITYPHVIEEFGWPVVSKDQACAISRYRNTSDPVQKHRRLYGWPNGTKGMISKKYRYLINAPFKISDACCDVMKKRPFLRYVKETNRHPFLGIMAGDSKRRQDKYQEYGCNAYDMKDPKSMPLSIWTEADVWSYIRSRNIPYSSIYDMGYERTGCIFCMFGVHMEKPPNRFQRMKLTHPRLWAYCMDKLGLRAVADYMDVPVEWSALKPRAKLRASLRKRGVLI
jgi:3'-phosphoadenosine 5'-phosphosulfate sulfotransferase (PAPS reductase)/FAD synthetase